MEENIRDHFHDEEREDAQEAGREAGSVAERLYYAIVAHPLFGEGGGEVVLEILEDDEGVVAFAGEPRGTDDDRAFAAVFSAEQPGLDRLLSHVHLVPNRYQLPDPRRGEAPAHVVVVDPDPAEEMISCYTALAATTVTDARFAAPEIEAAYRSLQRAGPVVREDEQAVGAEELPESSAVEETRLVLRGSGTGPRALSAEELEAIAAYEGLTWWDKLKSMLTTFALPMPPRIGLSPPYERLRRADAELFLRATRPAVVVLANNKGGCGKTTLAINLAAALSKVAHPASKEWTGPLRILLLDQNFGNSDIRGRVRLPAGRVFGLRDFLADREKYLRRLDDLDQRGLAEPPPGEPPLVEPKLKRDPDDGPEYPYPSYAFEFSGAAFDVCLLTAGSHDKRLEGKVTGDDLEALFDAAAGQYDIVVVDTDKGRPSEERMVSENLRFWFEEADVVFLPVDNSDSSYTEAAGVIQDVREHFEELNRQPGVPPVSPPAMCVVRNEWDESCDHSVWERAIEKIEADPPRTARGSEGPFLRVPRDPQVAEFAREGRAIALQSERHRDAFEPMAIAALIFAKWNRQRED